MYINAKWGTHIQNLYSIKLMNDNLMTDHQKDENIKFEDKMCL